MWKCESASLFRMLWHLKKFLFLFLFHFYHYHLGPLYPPPHHTVIHVHESFLLFAQPFHPPTSALLSCLAIYAILLSMSLSLFYLFVQFAQQYGWTGEHYAKWNKQLLFKNHTTNILILNTLSPCALINSNMHSFMLATNTSVHSALGYSLSRCFSQPISCFWTILLHINYHAIYKYKMLLSPPLYHSVLSILFSQQNGKLKKMF